MKPAAFAYARARSVEHAIELLGDPNGDARVLAGGQSLVPALNLRLSNPRLLVDINGIAGLDRVSLDGDALTIGALVRQADAERSPLVTKHTPLLARALSHVAHPAIRNRGTVGGSIAFADPAAELPACLLALGGEVEIAGPKGRRRVKADDFFKSLYETAIGRGELLTAIRVPAAKAIDRFGFAELARRHGDYALVGLAAHARVHEHRLAEVRLAFFGVDAVPIRAKRAEQAIAEDALDDAVEALGDDLDPSDDVHASSHYRRHAAGVLLRQVIGELKGTPG